MRREMKKENCIIILLYTNEKVTVVKKQVRELTYSTCYSLYLKHSRMRFWSGTENLVNFKNILKCLFARVVFANFLLYRCKLTVCMCSFQLGPRPMLQAVSSLIFVSISTWFFYSFVYISCLLSQSFPFEGKRTIEDGHWSREGSGGFHWRSGECFPSLCCRIAVFTVHPGNQFPYFTSSTFSGWHRAL